MISQSYSCEMVSLMSVPNPRALDILHTDMLHDVIPSSLVSVTEVIDEVSTVGDGRPESL